jgi:predicted nucleic acid-binding protein
MSGSIKEEEKTRPSRFVVDTNVFVAAIKPFSKRPEKKSRGATGKEEETRTLSLLIKLIVGEELELVGNSILVDEYRRLAEELESETSSSILKQLIEKLLVVEVKEDFPKKCEVYLPESETADIAHAPTCLQVDAILITNDRDFSKIRESGIVRVWNITEAIGQLR